MEQAFDGTLPVSKKYNVGMYNWGLVDGKTQIKLPWDSWYNPYINQQYGFMKYFIVMTRHTGGQKLI